MRTSTGDVRAPLAPVAAGPTLVGMKPITLTAALAPVLAAVALGCGGQSDQEKATSKVCDARDSIAKEVDTLKGMTVSNATKAQITDSLQTIRGDLTQIADAQGDLNAERKDQVQKANETFKAEVRNIATTVGSTTSLEQAKSQLTTALQQLATSYESTFAKVDCGN